MKLKAHYERNQLMGRRKKDRRDKVMQTFETTKPLKARLQMVAERKNITISALIREILERYFEDRDKLE